MKQHRTHSLPLKGTHSVNPGLQDLIRQGYYAFGGFWNMEDPAGNSRTQAPPPNFQRLSSLLSHFLSILDVARFA